MPKIIKNGKVIGSSPSALSGLLDVTISSPSTNQVLAYNNGVWENSDFVFTKMGYVPDGSYSVYGLWTDTYYSSVRMWIPFPRADKYTITITKGRYRSGTSAMTDIALTNIGIAGGTQTALGFLVYANADAAALHYGEVTFTATRVS